MKSNENLNQKSKGTEIKDPNPDDSTNLSHILVFLFFPIIMTAYFWTTQFSTKSRTWRVKEISKRIKLAHLVSIPVALLSLYLGFTTFSFSHIQYLVIAIIFFWIASIPTAFAIVSMKLTEIAGDISESRFSVKYLSATQRAMRNQAFERAHRKFESLSFQLPIYSSTNKSVVGLDAHPTDYRPKQMRKNLPDVYRLDSVVEGDFVIFDQDKGSPKSQLVIGGTGSGKTRLLSRMASAALAEDWRVVIVDFKGGQEEKLEYSSLGKFVPTKNTRVVNFPGVPIDLFRGTKKDIADRMISCLPPATGGDGDYYRQRAVRAISAVITRTSAPAPKDVETVLERIRMGEAYADDELDREMFKQKEKGIPVGHILAEGIAARFEPIRGTGEWATTGGFSWSDPWDLAVFSLDATRETEVRLGDLILMDFDMWLKSDDRETQPKPILLIVDEAGVLEKLPTGSVNLLNIVARGRSSRVGVVIATQTLASLGANYVGLNEQIASKWIGRTVNPEELINTIGTKDVLEVAYEWSQEGWENPKSGRMQRAYIVDPDQIRQLKTFYWSYSEGGKNRFVYAPPLNYRK